MLDTVLNFIVDELNGFLMNINGTRENMTVLASLTNPDGSIAGNIGDKIVLTLVNLEQQTVATFGNMNTGGDIGYERNNPPLHLNLYVLVSASFVNYPFSLKMLAQAMSFFQAKNRFDAQNSVNFPAGYDVLNLEIVNLGMAESNQLWASLGTRYLPSVVYKIRVTVPPAGIKPLPPAIRHGVSGDSNS